MSRWRRHHVIVFPGIQKTDQMRITLAVFPLLLSLSLLAQDTPGSDLDFMLGKIRQAYAGYTDKVHPQQFDKLISQARQTSSADTFSTLSSITGYFKDDHLALFQVVTLTAKDSAEATANQKNITTWTTGQGHPKDAAEGYWLDDLNNCILFLRKTAAAEWQGTIVETKDKAPAGLATLRLKKEATGQYIADYKDMDGGFRVITGARFKDPRVLVGGSYFKFRRIDHYVPGMLTGKIAFSYDPSVTQLDSQTVLFRMPDFGGYNAKRYDSLVKANAAVLARAKTLILDIRNNAGGSVRCFTPLLPYVCTSPVRQVFGYQLCSQALIDDATNDLKTYEKANDTVRAARTRGNLDTMRQNKDSFRLIGGTEFPCQPLPNGIQHVAVLMDHGSRSAAELMVLYFRQSKKVRLFGENTAGAVDYLDLLTYWLPQSHFQFWVGTTKRRITPDQPLYDAHGIPPDTMISEDQPDWIDFIRKYYGNGGKP